MTEHSVKESSVPPSDKPSQNIRQHWIYALGPGYKKDTPYLCAGKWCIYVPLLQVDAAWEVIRTSVMQGNLFCGKVATALHSVPYETNLICVYTPDWNDQDDVRRAREVLRGLGFTDELGYKRDDDTRAGKYGGADEWYLRA